MVLPVAIAIFELGATLIVLSTDPGITEGAAKFYKVALLPGSLLFGAGGAILANIVFGIIVGLTIHAWHQRRP